MVHRAAHCRSPARRSGHCVMLVAVKDPHPESRLGGTAAKSWSLNFYLSLPSETPDKVCRGTPTPWGPSSSFLANRTLSDREDVPLMCRTAPIDPHINPRRLMLPLFYK